jgi:hypothetical protein
MRMIFPSRKHRSGLRDGSAGVLTRSNAREPGRVSLLSSRRCYRGLLRVRTPIVFGIPNAEISCHAAVIFLSQTSSFCHAIVTCTSYGFLAYCARGRRANRKAAAHFREATYALEAGGRLSPTARVGSQEL